VYRSAPGTSFFLSGKKPQRNQSGQSLADGGFGDLHQLSEFRYRLGSLLLQETNQRSIVVTDLGHGLP
jgi:hypothetical protein